MTTRLWDHDHPYYPAEGSYCQVGYHNTYESWASFEGSMLHNGDRDLNLLYRWDWHKPGHNDWDGSERLFLYFVLQRKAACCSAEIPITADDEPAVRAWLNTCATTTRAIWAPILDTNQETAS